MITNIPRSKLEPHPDNPRKDLGDLTELAASIRKQGLLQNLTVVPSPDSPDKYRIVIGHRRFSASGIAGLDELPCIIDTKMTYPEQIAVMMSENIQRNDLTITEAIVIFDDCEDAEELLQRTYEKLLMIRYPKLTITGKVVDLERVWGYQHETVRLGDDVLVIADEWNATYQDKTRRGKRIPYVSHYLRYMDDMLLFGNSKRDLEKAVREIQEYCKTELGLTIKPAWEIRKIAECVRKENGHKVLFTGTAPIDIVGYRFYRNRTEILHQGCAICLHAEPVEVRIVYLNGQSHISPPFQRQPIPAAYYCSRCHQTSDLPFAV